MTAILGISAYYHESHAASAFFPSPFEEAAILTLDGVGEWATASFGLGSGNRIALSHELHFPHSLGLLYSAFTYFCGFKVNSGEYKLMGLAPYGEPRYVDLILDKLVDLKDDGSFRLDLDFFNYCQGLRMTSKRFERLFGGLPRPPESPLTQREMDLAVAVPAVGWFSPRFLRLVFVGMSYAAFPVGFVVSHVVLAVVFYGVLTPIGLIMRIFGYDSMKRRFDADTDSYWVERDPSGTEPTRYFRQF